MPTDRVADNVGKQLFPEEWREDLERQLKEGIGFACPHCKESISFQPDSDLEEDVKTRRTVIDRLLAQGMWVVQIDDDECTEEANRKKPFYRVLTLGDDGKIQASTLMPDAMPEFLESSARAVVNAKRSAAKISETAAGVRAVLCRVLTANFKVQEDDLSGVPDGELVGILNRLHGLNLFADIGTALELGQLRERLHDLTFNDPDTIIGIGAALGMNEDDMRQKMLATFTLTATGDEKAARAELAKSVTDTAKVMLARFKYACEAAGVEQALIDNMANDSGAVLRELSAKIKARRASAEAARLLDK